MPKRKLESSKKPPAKKPRKTKPKTPKPVELPSFKPPAAPKKPPKNEGGGFTDAAAMAAKVGTSYAADQGLSYANDKIMDKIDDFTPDNALGDSMNYLAQMALDYGQRKAQNAIDTGVGKIIDKAEDKLGGGFAEGMNKPPDPIKEDTHVAEKEHKINQSDPLPSAIPKVIPGAKQAVRSARQGLHKMESSINQLGKRRERYRRTVKRPHRQSKQSARGGGLFHDLNLGSKTIMQGVRKNTRISTNTTAPSAQLAPTSHEMNAQRGGYNPGALSTAAEGANRPLHMY